ncbi:hypothetical protein JX265_009857 [Neoarthrinium moseri]|uniref:NWD NACHT-NTPase N-terminal domain-containing protein n=1 Tax=Neoarthrinium moseri TaxID=1658444 RepID=A0A9P9WFF1_9PEZI|nr:hypothetical protein JX265_009857 [Neoarthrinium moseri]
MILMQSAMVLRVESRDLWHQALANLDPDDKSYLDFDGHDQLDIVEQVLSLTDVAQKHCEAKAWSFKRKSGERVIVRDVLAKVARWIKHFVAVGDAVVQYDPAHAALPWAGVRFILQICIDDFKTYDFLLEKIPVIVHQLCRSALMEELLAHTPRAAASELERALVKLHSATIMYLARTKAYWEQSTRKRILRSLTLSTSDLEISFDKITDAQADVQTCFQIASVQAQLTKLDNLRVALDEFDGPFSRWDDKLNKITDGLDRSKRADILKWLSGEPYLKYHKAQRETFLEGTGQWLLSHPTFKRCKEESASSILWLHGILGSGKSKLTSLVVEDGIEAFRRQQAPQPAYFYCSRNPAEPERSDPACIMASIVRHLSSLGPGKPLLQPTISTYQSHEDEGFAAGSLGLKDSRDLLLQLLEKFPTATIIIDALDECRTDTRRQLLDCLEYILLESTTLVYPGLELSSRLNSKDITYFVKSETDQLIARGQLLRSSTSRIELSAKIVEDVTDGAQGMFRWASLQLQLLCDQVSDAAVRERLGRLPPTLEALYQELLDKIRAYTADADRQYARNTLVWLLCGRRRLSSNEFFAAVSIIPDHPPSAVTKGQILQLCYNLITFDSTQDSFRFAHLSVREFLENDYNFNQMATNSIVADCCRWALMSWTKPVISDNSDTTTFAVARLEDIQRYANTYWAEHYQAAGEHRKQGYLYERMQDFLSDTATDSAFVLWHQFKTSSDVDICTQRKIRNCQTHGPSKLVVASTYNLIEIVEAEKQHGISLKENEGRNCLTSAVEYGDIKLWSSLLDIEEISVSEDALIVAAGDLEDRRDFMNLIFEKRGEQVQITEKVVQKAAKNFRYGGDIITLFLQKRGERLPITEQVVQVVAENGIWGLKVMALLLELRGEQIRITEQVVLCAAKNRSDARERMAFLLEKRGEQVPITQQIFEKAAWNRFDCVFPLLLEERGEQVQITSILVQAVSSEFQARQTMTSLLEKKGYQILNEEVIQVIARRFDEGILALHFEKQGEQVRITEEVVLAAAWNHHGPEVMALLLKKGGDQVQISEELLEVAIENYRGGELLAVLLERVGDQVQITNKMLKAAASNVYGYMTMAVLLKKGVDQVQITNEVVHAAAKRWNGGADTMALLLEKGGDQVQITDDIIRAARLNYCGAELRAVLIEKRGHRV